MDTKNNIDQTIDQMVTEFMAQMIKLGGDAILLASHQDMGRVRSSIYGSRPYLIQLVLSFAKGDKDFLNILKIALDIIEDSQEAEGADTEELPATTLPS